MSSMIAVSKIEVPDNVRKIDGVVDLCGTTIDGFPLDEKASILNLAQSIKDHGLLQPLVVKDLGSGKGYRLIAGYRRFKAVQHLGLKTVDVKSVKGKREDEKILQLVENIQREDLNPVDIANGLVEIREAKGIKKQVDIAKIVNKSSGWVSQHLSLLKADLKVQEAVSSGEMGLAAARTISSLDKSEQGGAVDSAKSEAKESGKKKITTKGAKKQAAKVKNKKNDRQSRIELLADRETAQKEVVVKDFLDVRFGDQDVPPGTKEFAGEFWDYLMSKNRLYIDPK